MERIARFSKVSYEQYKKDMLMLLWGKDAEWSDEEIRAEYDAIKLPSRATAGSAGYDFYLPHAVHFSPSYNSFFPTGIRCEMEQGWVLQLYPKSGLGTKYGTMMLNTIPIIDQDYFFADNEGHILIGMSVKKPFDLKAGDKFIQGLFVPFGITADDNATDKRTGGFGSTGVS